MFTPVHRARWMSEVFTVYYLSKEVSACMVMSLSGPCVSEGSPAGREVLEEVVSGGLTDWRHLRKTAEMQNVSATSYRMEIRLVLRLNRSHN